MTELPLIVSLIPLHPLAILLVSQLFFIYINVCFVFVKYFISASSASILQVSFVFFWFFLSPESNMMRRHFLSPAQLNKTLHRIFFPRFQFLYFTSSWSSFFTLELVLHLGARSSFWGSFSFLELVLHLGARSPFWSSLSILEFVLHFGARSPFRSSLFVLELAFHFGARSLS